MRKAADVLSSAPAMQIRYLETMQAMAKTANSKVGCFFTDTPGPATNIFPRLYSSQHKTKPLPPLWHKQTLQGKVHLLTVRDLRTPPPNWVCKAAPPMNMAMTTKAFRALSTRM